MALRFIFLSPIMKQLDHQRGEKRRRPIAWLHCESSHRDTQECLGPSPGCSQEDISCSSSGLCLLAQALICRAVTVRERRAERSPTVLQVQLGWLQSRTAWPALQVQPKLLSGNVAYRRNLVTQDPNCSLESEPEPRGQVKLWVLLGAQLCPQFSQVV